MNPKQHPLENPIRRAYLRVQNARQWKRQIARLGSANATETQEASAWLLAQGDVALPALYRALRRSPNVACGAAGLLYRMGSPQGVRHILLRAYQDEWFTFYSTRDVAEYGASIGLHIGKEAVSQAVWSALEAAREQREEQACLQTLIVALSGLRALYVIALLASRNKLRYLRRLYGNALCASARAVCSTFIKEILLFPCSPT